MPHECRIFQLSITEQKATPKVQWLKNKTKHAFVLLMTLRFEWKMVGLNCLGSTQYWLSQLNQGWRIHFQEAHSPYTGGVLSWLLIGSSTRLIGCWSLCKSLLSFLRAWWSCGRLTYDKVVASPRVSVPSCKASYHEVLEVSLFLPYLWIKPINKASLYSRERDFNSITQWEE